MWWKNDADPHNPENRNAGNGGDLVKHTVLLALLAALRREHPWRGGLRLIECHAGRGMYRLDDPDRRQLVATLMGSDLPLARAQRRARQALGADGGYAGSALLACTCLGSRDRYVGLEWAPDTREVLRGVLRRAATTALTIAGEPGERFEGESQLADAMPTLSERDVVWLDPFGIWRRPKLAPRRARYRRLFEAWCGHAAPPPLSLFFTWSTSDAADADIDGHATPVDDGYAALRAMVGEIIVVRWRWGLPCAMWLLVPAPIRHALAAELSAATDALAAAFGDDGPTRLDVTG